MFKTQKLHHIIKKRVIYKGLLSTDLPMCSHRIKGMYFLCTNLVLKSIFGLQVYTLRHEHLVHCWTTGLGDEIYLTIIINTRIRIFNGPTLKLLYCVFYNLPATYLLLGKCGENTFRIVLKRVNYSILFGVVDDEVKKV